MPFRAKVREIADSGLVTIVMMLVTIYALIGDDFRAWFSSSQSDPYFWAALCFSLVAFTIEIMVNSCVIDDFKWSFFFWLDIIATLSIIMDIPWITDSVNLAVGSNPSYLAVDVNFSAVNGKSRSFAKVTKILKSLRLIRLIRIIKLYKYAVKTSEGNEEAKMREQQKAASNALQAKLKRELEPSRLGKALSDTLTRRLIIGVLLLLMVLPAISFTQVDNTFDYGIKQVFWFGRSNCNIINGQFFCGDRVNWLTNDGWQSILRNFVQATSITDNSLQATKNVLWMYVPDFEKNGQMGEIQNVTRKYTQYAQAWTDLDTIRNISQD